MSDEGLNRIAGGLGITLPLEYRELMLARGAEFRASAVGHWLWSSANQVIIKNLEERDGRGGTSGAYPKWWKEYLLIGDNGDCEFFCLRLDGDPAVYKIGSDDDGPEKVAKSLNGYLKTKWVKPLLKPQPQPKPVARGLCPCCGYLTIPAGQIPECPVCMWEDDGRSESDADQNRGFPNHISLTAARANFRAFGACSEPMKGMARPPTKEEMTGQR